MTSALTPPFMAAALVLVVAGTAKLRTPRGALNALIVTGLPARPALVRLFAAGEVALGVACLLDPSVATAAAAAILYAVFAAISLVLARRRSSCGCFGEGNEPTTVLQSLLGALLALVAAGAVLWRPHGVDWLLSRPPHVAVALAIGTAAAAYAIVLAYTQLPQAWGSWQGAAGGST